MATKIMMDTGCPLELVGQVRAASFEDTEHARSVLKQNFNTAGGKDGSSLVIDSRIRALDDDHCEFYVMKSSPTVFSVGKRCAKRGFCFIWLRGLVPCLITPSFKIVPLDVIAVQSPLIPTLNVIVIC